MAKKPNPYDVEVFGIEVAQLFADRRQPIPWGIPDWLPEPEERKTLEQMAGQPGNFKSGKRARFLLMFWEGKSCDEVTTALKVSESTLQRWFYSWSSDGLRGVTHPHRSSLT